MNIAADTPSGKAEEHGGREEEVTSIVEERRQAYRAAGHFQDLKPAPACRETSARDSKGTEDATF